MSDSHDVPLGLAVPAVASRFNDLHARCGEILGETIADPRLAVQSNSLVFLADLGGWLEVLAERPEAQVLRTVASEYDFALLALAHGQYRHAFMGLRLALELGLSTVHYSAHLLELAEWLNGDRDVNWNQLTDSEGAVLSRRFCKAFFPSLQDRATHYNTLARSVYRDCSQYVHANPSSTEALPDSLRFDVDAFNSWHRAADAVSMVITFALILRYALTLSEMDRDKLETSVLTRLGHVAEFRIVFGGVTGE